ncbi:MAG: hypothetical protein P8M87_06870 [Crocinitomicaceae bacterium]|nr:hypothetical protein [Crocinitomicaceae bacterium]
MNFKVGKILFILLSFALPVQLFGQFWFDIAIGGSSGTSIVSDFSLYEDTRIDVTPKFSSNGFIKVGLNINEKASIVFDLGISNRNFQLTQNNIPTITEITTDVIFGYSGLRVLPMYRHTKEGTYLEIGPEFGFTRSQYFNDNANGPIKNTLFTEQITRVAIGFGGYILGNERVTLVSGLRILYDLSDLRKSQAIEYNFPFQNFADQKSKPFKAFDIQLSLELNISLGFLARSSCGKRTLMFHW